VSFPTRSRRDATALNRRGSNRSPVDMNEALRISSRSRGDGVHGGDMRARSALVKMYRPFLPVAPAIVYPVGPREEHGKRTHRDPTCRSQCRAPAHRRSRLGSRQPGGARILCPIPDADPGSLLPACGLHRDLSVTRVTKDGLEGHDRQDHDEPWADSPGRWASYSLPSNERVRPCATNIRSLRSPYAV
jgi:hypothetical protein